MSIFSLNIETENASFEDGEGQEIARILRELANRLEHEQKLLDVPPYILRDSNGNRVGKTIVS